MSYTYRSIINNINNDKKSQEKLNNSIKEYNLKIEQKDRPSFYHEFHILSSNAHHFALNIKNAFINIAEIPLRLYWDPLCDSAALIASIAHGIKNIISTGKKEGSMNKKSTYVLTRIN